MVIDINRIFSGLLLIASVLLCYVLNFDYLILISLVLFTIYDLKISRFICNSIDYLILIIFMLAVPIIYHYIEFIIILNILLISCILLNIFFSSFFFKKIFFISIFIFILNFYSIFLINRDYLYFIIFVAFFNDTIAYISGKSIKGPLIIPSISPNKTWSGTIISFCLTLLVIYQYNVNFFISILLSISLFFGDIFFSYIKRKFNLKDFSSLLKGHGGILDRLDSMFFFTIILNFYYLI